MAGNKAGAGKDNCFQQIMAGAYRADRRQVRANMPAFSPYRMAARTCYLLSKENASAASYVSASREEKLELFQVAQAGCLLYFKTSLQRVCCRLYLWR